MGIAHFGRYFSVSASLCTAYWIGVSESRYSKLSLMFGHYRNQFVMEYSGEVMGYDEFEKRVEAYDRENRRHYYFMTLRADEVSLSLDKLSCT